MEHLLFLFIQLRMLCHYKEKHRTNGLSWAPAPTIKIYVQSHRCKGILEGFELSHLKRSQNCDIIEPRKAVL